MNFSRLTPQIPQTWKTLKTIEMHTCGEPLRVIVEGYPEFDTDSLLDYRAYIQKNHDDLRTTLMLEPRGHADMYGAVIVPSKVADFGAVFIHNEGYSTMCGHAVIALSKLAVESKWISASEPETNLLIEAPCGVIKAYVSLEQGEVNGVRFLNVPSYVSALKQKIEVDGIGEVEYDLAYGGAYYAYVDADSIGLSLESTNFRNIIQAGIDIKASVMQNSTIVHPLEKDLSFLYGVIFVKKSDTPNVDFKNVCVFANGEVDRSPTGSGVSGLLAILQAKNELGEQTMIRVESIIGSWFDCQINEITEFADYPAVIPEVRGSAYITGFGEYVIDPDDPLRDGFFLR